jgi:hypothetical protein
MLSAMDQFVQVMETSMTKRDKGMAAAPMTRDVDHDFATQKRSSSTSNSRSMQ